jgi:hypothetical protein
MSTTQGCKRDTDGDGNCPQHPAGCPPEPMTEERLKEIEAWADQEVHLVSREHVPALIAEIRRLWKDCDKLHADEARACRDLLHERAIQAEELLNQRDLALLFRDTAEAREMEYWVALLSACAVIDKLRSGRPVDGAWYLRLAEVDKAVKGIPAQVLAVHRARLAVVEAARAEGVACKAANEAWSKVDWANATEETPELLAYGEATRKAGEASERTVEAVEALEKVEARP